MDDILDVMSKRDELFLKTMENHSFMQVFYGDLEGDEEEIILKNKFILLNKAIDDFHADICGCGKGIRIQAMKSLVKEIQSYI